MASKARKSFDENTSDIDRLLALHQEKGGMAPGRRVGLEVLNKSAIVLITSFWEAYCEDLAAEALEHLVDHVASPDDLPLGVRKTVAKEIRSDSHELAPWTLSGDAWRDHLRSRLSQLQEERDRSMNTPKSSQVDRLFEHALGFKEVSSSWTWKNMTAAQAKKKLNFYVELRGAIAHRGKSGVSVRKTFVEDYFRHVKSLAKKTGGRVSRLVKNATGKALW